MTGGWNLHRRREQQWQPPLPAPGQALQSYTAGLSNWWLGNRLGNSPGEKQNKSYKEVLFQVLIKVQKNTFPGVSGAIVKFHWRKMEKEDMYM